MPALNLLMLCDFLEIFEQIAQGHHISEETLRRFQVNGLKMNDIQDIYTIWDAIISGEGLTVEELETYNIPEAAQVRWFGSLDTLKRVIACRAVSQRYRWAGKGYAQEPDTLARALTAMHRGLAPLGFVLLNMQGQALLEFHHPQSRQHLILHIRQVKDDAH